mmetsp:Transcript_55571/g.178287  ORF Transcript_55571/g.178287 Transcript_55571/m.178287 type:complete len:221 (+) Transcript_55571:306-968(+)
MLCRLGVGLTLSTNSRRCRSSSWWCVGSGLGLRLGLPPRPSPSSELARLCGPAEELPGVFSPKQLTELPMLATPPEHLLEQPSARSLRTACSILSSNCRWSCSSCARTNRSCGKVRRAASSVLGLRTQHSQRVLACTTTTRSTAVVPVSISFISPNTVPPIARNTQRPPTSTEASPRRMMCKSVSPRPPSAMTSPGSENLVLPCCTRKLISSRSQPRKSS